MTRKAALLVYDGDCAFCTRTLSQLQASLERFPDAHPWQDLDLNDVGLSRSEVTKYVWLLAGSKRLRGHEVFAALLQAQPAGSFRFLGYLMAVPPFSWLMRLGYFFLARFRHRLPGGTAACEMPRD